ncbi:hypothetical protein BHE90_009496 [Fusarium euwallaceae]|uniref:Protein kinase domain-containing protein n=1 Tax=Fusarium euwallaceae TaxID=1147111 RepID=A0A430LK28_9HYPO|nr:hypothetical protein BHE90_009496 [Fusarium euwallaceae]
MSSSAPFEFSSLTYTLDDVIAETEDTAANTDDPALRTAELDLDKLVESPELSSIFALACLFNVPLFLTNETGTMVALKRYHPPTPGLRDRESSMVRIHKLLGQELRAHCFPALREHENICKLLFLGWEDTSLLPAAALELATFGTLDDALQDMRSYSSALTKAHITFDIVAGLTAVHQCGLVHGDVKPGNIIICEHPSRLVIAKISDLNGVAPSESYGKKQSFFCSPLWQAPEALQRENNIDWQLCDVYSLAMVLTTIWTTKGWIPPGGCFLDPLLEYDYKDDAYMQRIEAAKLLPDRFDGSMVKTVYQSLEGANIPPNLPMKDIISLGLSAIASRRPPLTEIMSRYLSKFAQECGRTMQLASSDR